MTLLLIFAILGCIMLTLFSEKGELGWSVFVFFAFMAFAIFIDKRFSINDIGVFFQEHTGKLTGGAVVYVFAGILWAILKWKWYVGERYERYSYYSLIRASENKARITGWMIWWPLSLGWWILHDPITRFYDFLHRKLSRVFDNISTSEREKKIFRDKKEKQV